jgi:hypothetical protein
LGALVRRGDLTPYRARQTSQAGGRSYLFPGRVLAHRWHGGQGIELTCQNAMAQIAVLAPDLMRVRVSPTGKMPAPFSYAVAKDAGAQGRKGKRRRGRATQYVPRRTTRDLCCPSAMLRVLRDPYRASRRLCATLRQHASRFTHHVSRITHYAD